MLKEWHQGGMGYGKYQPFGLTPFFEYLLYSIFLPVFQFIWNRGIQYHEGEFFQRNRMPRTRSPIMGYARVCWLKLTRNSMIDYISPRKINHEGA
jgi:hypothetical protein